MKLQKILTSSDTDTKAGFSLSTMKILGTNGARQRQNLEYIVENVVDLLKNTTSKAQCPRNVSFLAQLFQLPVNIDSLLCISSLYQRAGKHDGVSPATKREQQLSAKLHCLYGVPIEYPKRIRCTPVYPYAASKVYDLRQYTDKTYWGPFLDDGSQDVDWEKVEAIMVVLGHNLQIFSERTHGSFKPRWAEPFSGANPESYIAPYLPGLEGPSIPLDLRDPYNVTGTWLRVRLFLDLTGQAPTDSSCRLFVSWVRRPKARLGLSGARC